MSSLYELTADYQQLQELLESGEYTPEELADTIEGIEGEYEMKAEAIAKVMRNCDGEVAAYTAEIERLQHKKAAAENTKSRLKSYLQNSMMVTGKTKFKTGLFSFGIRKNGGKAPLILDNDKVDDYPYNMIKLTKSIDKDAVRTAIEDGTLPEGLAHIGERGESLVIK